MPEKAIEKVAKALRESAGTVFPHAGEICGMKHQLVCIITLAREALYPEIFGQGNCTGCSNRETVLEELAKRMQALLKVVLGDSLTEAGLDSEGVTLSFIEMLPEIKALLETDIEAAYLGDPAAKSREEILLAYPSFEALSVFRMAHALYEMGVPLLPRMMTEYAHKNTGIDIHPGASIGSYFFIDHGTGVVIGETANIGHRVKLYQGVTLGAKSFPLDEKGNPIKGIQRHPTLGDGVVVYAGATILGGDTYIGDGAVIGGNVWLTQSVEAGSVVQNPKGELKTKKV